MLRAFVAFAAALNRRAVVEFALPLCAFDLVSLSVAAFVGGAKRHRCHLVVLVVSLAAAVVSVQRQRRRLRCCSLRRREREPCVCAGRCGAGGAWAHRLGSVGGMALRVGRQAGWDAEGLAVGRGGG